MNGENNGGQISYTNESQFENKQKNKKSNNGFLIVIIVILVLIIAFLLMYVLINKSSNGTSDNTNKNSENNNISDQNNTSSNDTSDEVTFVNLDYTPKCQNKLEEGEKVLYTSNFDESKYSDITEYLKAQKNLTAVAIASNFEGKYADISLTKEQLENVVNEMDKDFNITASGVGGAGSLALTIKYTKGDKQLFVTFAFLHQITTNDGDLLRLMDYIKRDSEVDKTLFPNATECYYGIENLGSTMTSISNDLLSKIN